MSGKWPGGVISKTAPTVTGPTDGEGGSASGIWTLDQAADYEKQGLWPKPLIAKELLNWGNNYQGQMGQGNSGPAVPTYSSPVQLGSFDHWMAVTKTHNSTAAVNSLGELWTWGKNYYGQLGDGSNTNRSSPVQVGSATWMGGDLDGGGGADFVLLIKSTGELWAWGYNAWGQLGDGTVTVRSSPVQVGLLTNWSKLGVGTGSSFAIKNDDTLWVWGLGSLGALGLGNTTTYSSPKQLGTDTWSQIKGSKNGCRAIRSDGTLWGWGDNAHGQVGSGNTTTYSSPVQIGALTDWLKVISTYKSTLAVKTDGTLWAWGKNAQGQLGLGDTTDRSSPVQVGALTNWTTKIAGYSNGCTAIKSDGTWWTWGTNSDGQLGLNNTTSYSSPKQLGSLTTWVRTANGAPNSTFNTGLKTP
jgi:alpha-tubulin suppressor-like RCC1 family protein